MQEMGLPLGFVAPRESARYDDEAGNVVLDVAQPKKRKKKKRGGGDKDRPFLHFTKDKVRSKSKKYYASWMKCNASN
jgi:hypothetical protein